MKRLLVLIFCLALPFGLMAQQRTGSITGTVVDSEGNPLPGVSLTLTGETIAPMTTVTNAEGKFRFLSLFPANDYALKAELQGFKTKIETGIIVNVAKTSDISITMEQGALEEQVTVIAETPIVQAKKTQITHTVNDGDARSAAFGPRPLGRPADDARRVQIDRENVGGVESGQQSDFFAKGSTTQEWTDGRHADHGPQLGRLARVLRLRLVRGNEHLDGDPRRRAPRSRRRRQHGHPPRRQQDRASAAGSSTRTRSSRRRISRTRSWRSSASSGLQPGQRHQGLRLQRRRPLRQGQGLVVGQLRRPAGQDPTTPSTCATTPTSTTTTAS